MSSQQRSKIYQSLYETGMMPLFYHGNVKTAIDVMRACAGGGAKHLEFTNRGEGALEVFKELRKVQSNEFPELSLGIGSIVDSATAAMFITAGAQFIVGPCLDESVASLCNQKKIAYMPGCMTVTEVHKAHSFGVEICKIFPGDAAGGPSFIKSVLAPMPWASLMPTGGVDVTEKSLQSWIKAGCSCVGLGSKLISKDILENQKFAELETNVNKVLGTIVSIRRS